MSEEKQSIFQKEITLGKVFPDKSKEGFYTEFGSLLESGIDIQRALQLLIEEQEKKKIMEAMIISHNDIWNF